MIHRVTGSFHSSSPPSGSDAGRLRWLGLLGATLLLVLGPHWFPVTIAEEWGDPPDLWKLRCGLSLFFAVAVLWISEALPLSMTALLVPVLAQIMGIMPMTRGLHSFADPLIFLFLGGFALATALSTHGLDLWFACRILRFAGNRFLPASCLMFVASAMISMWISNTATTALMLPLGIGLISSSRVGGADRNAGFLLLGLAYSASIGGLATIVGSPPNGIVARELGLSFGQWMKFGLVSVLVLLPAMVLVLHSMLSPVDATCDSKGGAERLSSSHRPVLWIFFCTALFWAAGGWIAPFTGIGTGYDTIVSLVAVFALIAFRVITWEQFERGTPWGVLLLFGGGLSLGQMLKESSASVYLAHWVAERADGMPLLLVAGWVVMFTIFLTELASNTAVAALFVPVFATVAEGMDMAPQILLMPLGLAASCAFMFPVATAPNALVHATGLIPSRQMMRTGLILNLVCGAILTTLAWLLLR